MDYAIYISFSFYILHLMANYFYFDHTLSLSKPQGSESPCYHIKILAEKWKLTGVSKACLVQWFSGYELRTMALAGNKSERRFPCVCQGTQSESLGSVLQHKTCPDMLWH